MPCSDALYSVHVKQGADENAPKTMRVDYKVGFYQFKSEWVCFEHSGYARWKAEMWWQARSLDPVPATAQEAVDIANAGGLAPTQCDHRPQRGRREVRPHRRLPVGREARAGADRGPRIAVVEDDIPF